MTSEFSVAVHALVFLNHKARVLSSEELAENICTNPARVRKVMARLKKAGLIETKEGAEGGYSFRLPPESVTLRRIGEALNLSFVSSSWRSGDVDHACLISSGMAGVMEEIYGELNEQCKKRLEQITIQTIDGRIFPENSEGNHPSPQNKLIFQEK